MGKFPDRARALPREKVACRRQDGGVVGLVHLFPCLPPRGPQKKTKYFFGVSLREVPRRGGRSQFLSPQLQNHYAYVTSSNFSGLSRHAANLCSLCRADDGLRRILRALACDLLRPHGGAQREIPRPRLGRGRGDFGVRLSCARLRAPRLFMGLRSLRLCASGCPRPRHRHQARGGVRPHRKGARLPPHLCPRHGREWREHRISQAYGLSHHGREALFKQGRWMSLIWLEKEVNAPECAASFPRPLSALPAHIWEEL